MAHLIHASLVESHDGGMGESVEHGAQCLLRVKLLRLEKLFQELFVEHGGDNVIHNYPEKREKHIQIKVGSASCTIWLRGIGRGYNILCAYWVDLTAYTKSLLQQQSLCSMSTEN